MNKTRKSSQAKQKKRPLSEWNLFVMEVKKRNPEKMFKDVLVLAGQLKKKGVKYSDYVKNKSSNAVAKISKVTSTLYPNQTLKNKKAMRKLNKKKGKRNNTRKQ